jgi:hypothetical protein
MAGLQEWLDDRGASLQEEFTLTRKLEARVKLLEAVLVQLLEVTKFDDDPVFSPTVEYCAALNDARDALKE